MRIVSDRIMNRPARAGRFLLAILLISLPLVVGCGGEERYPVSGKVVINGQATADMFVKFEPNGEGEPAWGNTDSQGRFELTGSGESPGILPGTYRVWIDFRAPEPDPNLPQPPDGIVVPQAVKDALKKYGSKSSQLTIEINGPRTDLVIPSE